MLLAIKTFFSKIWGYIVAFFSLVAVVAMAIFTLFYKKKTKEEKERLEKVIEKNKDYNKKKKQIEEGTDEKINKLSNNDSDSFDASVELLHKASNRE